MVAGACLAALGAVVVAGGAAVIAPAAHVEAAPSAGPALALPAAGEAVRQARRRALDPFEIRAQRPASTPMALPGAVADARAPDRPVWSSPPGDPRGQTRVLSGLPPASEAPPPSFARAAGRPGTPGAGAAVATADQPRSELPLGATTESWHAARVALEADHLPAPSAVLPESFLRAFPHAEAPPPPGVPLALTAELAPDPLAPGWHTLRVAVQAADTATGRLPQHLIVVIDGSGSMGLDGRLDGARRAVAAVAAGLQPGDTLSILRFSERAEVLLPQGPARLPRVRAALAAVTADGPSDLGAGLEAAWSMAPLLPRAGARRVVLLTDGEPNTGLARMADWQKQARGWRIAGVPLTVAQVGDAEAPGPLLEGLAAAAGARPLTLSTAPRAAGALRDALLDPASAAAHDARVAVTFSADRVTRWRLVGWDGAAAVQPLARLPAGHTRAALYRLSLAEGAGPIATVEARARRGDGRAWTDRLHLTDAHRAPTLAQAGGGLRVAWAASAFAELLRGDRAEGLRALADLLPGIRRPGRSEDVDLARLVHRAAGLAERPRLAASASPAVREAVSRQVEQVHYCAAELRRADPDLASAMDLELRVFAGRVAEARVLPGGSVDAELAACSLRKARRWRFPPALDADVVVPIRTEPARLALR